MKKIEQAFEHLLFASRWLMAPVYLALIVTLIIMMIKAIKQLFGLMATMMSADGQEIIVGVLSIVDVSLIMNLLIIIIFSGYENFVSKMEDLHEHADRPDWMGHIGFTDLKLKLIGSIVAISGVELLKVFMHVNSATDRELAWMVGIHLTFVISGVLYAWMDRINHAIPAHHSSQDANH
ncbi:TIGR00645 family protein [Thiolinea disciformis]|uniref:TIGR00645 family protein n=1 Tax=Thiolinea disciformis TaxID=125614 RepID=UPI0003804A93|nr:TIGR00645 family protein [Thiolinea disciformis]